MKEHWRLHYEDTLTIFLKTLVWFCYFINRIIGLYTTFVFLASRVIRGFFSGIYTKIMFDDLPNVDRVLQLCLDIYLVSFHDWLLEYFLDTKTNFENPRKLIARKVWNVVSKELHVSIIKLQVREALELSLEEDLFAKLVFLYRSPETMIKWSRPKEEPIEEQRALPPSRWSTHRAGRPPTI